MKASPIDETAALERLLIGHIEAHLGRVPTDDEVKQSGRRFVDLVNREEHYFWLGQRMFSIRRQGLGSGFVLI